MVKRLLIAIMIISASCTRQVYLQKIRMAPEFIIREVNWKEGYILGQFPCDDPPYKRQPCYSIVVFEIRYFNNPQLGQTVKLHQLTN